MSVCRMRPRRPTPGVRGGDALLSFSATDILFDRARQGADSHFCRVQPVRVDARALRRSYFEALVNMREVVKTFGVLMLGNSFWWYWMYGLFETKLTVTPNWFALLYAYLCVAFGVRFLRSKR